MIPGSPDAGLGRRHHSAGRPLFSRPRSFALITIIKDAILICLAVPGLIALLRPGLVCGGTSPPSQKAGQGTAAGLGACNCGHSVAEAISKGCKYDSLASAWLPAHCRDEELTAEFERSGHGPNGEWSYWLDINHTKELSLSELRTKGDDPDFRFYSTAEWHLVHCLFYWRKQHRARHTGVTIEPRFDTDKHIVHCGSVFMDRTADDRGSASGVVLNSDE